MSLFLSRTCVLDQRWMQSFRVGEEQLDQEEEIQRILQQQYEYLQQQSQDSFIIQAIQLATSSAAARILKLSDRPIANWRKKEKQSVRTLLQFMSRMSTKTSPFGYFTKIGLVDDNQVVPPVDAIWAQLNLHLLAYWQRLLEWHPDFSRALSVEVNPSLKVETAHYTFVLNNLNKETLQQMERGEVADYLVDMLEGTSMPLGNLLDRLSDEIDAPIEALESYIRQLLQLGFFNWKWPFTARDPHWLGALKTIVDQSGTRLQELSELIEDSQSFLKGLSTDTSITPGLKHLHQRYQVLAQSFREELKETIVVQEGITRLPIPPFYFKEEKMIYIDQIDQAPSVPPIAVKNSIPVLQRLGHWITERQSVDQIQGVIFWEKHFKDIEEVALLDYYKQWIQFPPEPVMAKQKVEVIYESEVRPSGVVSLKLGQPPAQDQVYIPSTAAYVLEGSGVALAYLNNMVEDFGRPIARFLNAYSDSTVQMQRESLLKEASTKNLMLAENADASYFNVNLHPPLTDWEIVGIDGHARLPKGQQLPLADLVIRKQGDRLGLFQIPSQTEIQVLSLGLEQDSNRSLLYQLLQVFGPAPPSYKSWLHEIRSRFIVVVEGRWMSYPRVLLEDVICIQRKGWYLLPDLITQIPNGVTLGDIHALMQFWRSQELPMQCYVRFDPPEVEGANAIDRQADHYKPQFFDFQSPLFCDLFLRLFRKVEPGVIQVEEVYPNIGEAKEWVVSLEEI